jgi:hypothetical protein
MSLSCYRYNTSLYSKLVADTNQGEIIKSLQMAAQHETAILNLRLLHEASITNRKDTFVILDEMKQRIILTRPIPRQIEGTEHRPSIATLSSSWPSNLRSMDVAPEGYMPSAVTIPSPAESKENRSGLARYFQMKRSTSASSKAMSTSVNAQAEAPRIDYCAALEQMAQAKGQDRGALMNDIDEIMVSYKGLNVNDEVTGQAWNNQQHPRTFPERRGTLNILNGNGYQQADMFSSSWGATPMSQQNQPLPHPHMGQQPTFNQDVFNGYPQYSPYAGPNPFPHHQTHMSHRLSDSSASSVPYSDRSWERNDSESSRSSYAQSDPRYSVSPSSNKSGFPLSSSPSPQQTTDYYGQLSSHLLTYASTDNNYASPIAPLSVPQRSPLRASPQNGGPVNAPPAPHQVTNPSAQNPHASSSQCETRVPSAIAPFGSPPDSPILKEEVRAESSPARPTMISPGPPSTHSSSSGHTVTFGAPSSPWSRALSAPVNRIRQPSIASTDSSGSGSIGILPRPVSIIPSSTIQSPKPGQERMMNGRPCKANDYWGFCKGAWDVREDSKMGLALRTMPSGMYNTKEVWECRSCNFRGNTYSIMTGKKGKKETITDPNIHTSKSGIRYRWVFLAKSHVKKKTPDSTSEECNYGCVICSVELKVTSIFGNVDTLMYHLLEHVSGMSQKSMLQTKCIVGRTAGPHEDWDINVPLFVDVSEVEG